MRSASIKNRVSGNCRLYTVLDVEGTESRSNGHELSIHRGGPTCFGRHQLRNGGGDVGIDEEDSHHVEPRCRTLSNDRQANLSLEGNVASHYRPLTSIRPTTSNVPPSHANIRPTYPLRCSFALNATTAGLNSRRKTSQSNPPGSTLWRAGCRCRRACRQEHK